MAEEEEFVGGVLLLRKPNGGKGDRKEIIFKVFSGNA